MSVQGRSASLRFCSIWAMLMRLLTSCLTASRPMYCSSSVFSSVMSSFGGASGAVSAAGPLPVETAVFGAEESFFTASAAPAGVSLLGSGALGGAGPQKSLPMRLMLLAVRVRISSSCCWMMRSLRSPALPPSCNAIRRHSFSGFIVRKKRFSFRAQFLLFPWPKRAQQPRSRSARR